MMNTLHTRLLAASLLMLGTAAAHAQTAQSRPVAASQAQAPQLQAPQAMNYQGIARDVLGKPLQNKNITLRISVLAGGADALSAYSETHRVTTTDQGAFALAIGRGTEAKGTFASLQWGGTNHFLRVEIDPAGGSNFRVMGTSELLSVPYALYAGMAGQLSTTTSAAGSAAQGGTPGVPSQVWSLFGNSNVNPLTDRLGTTNDADLVLITNNIDRLTITAQGNVAIRNDLGVGKDLTVNRNVSLNATGGATVNYGPLTVANASPTALSGTLNVTGATNLANTLNTVGATTLRNTLGVTGATTLLSTLNTVGATTLRSTLGVDGATDLNSTLNTLGATTLRNTLGVTGATNLLSTLNTVGATTLRSTLGVDGATDLNSTLNTVGATTLRSTLGVSGATNLASTLNTVGATTLRSTLGVTGATTLGSTLNTLGATTLRSTLGVTGATSLNSSLAVTGPTVLNNILAARGQVTISTNLSGGQDSYGAYPLRVQGSDQGMAIRLNGGTPQKTNNFITFFNSDSSAIGAIEGQTAIDVLTDPEYIFDNANLIIEEVAAGINFGTSFTPVVVAGLGASAGPCGACIAEATVNLAVATANLTAYNVFALQNLGVTYQSGSADYAEWLERSNVLEKITAGDIVAVNGGKISKVTTDGQQFMVISTKPAVLGNMPAAGQEAASEKVAFMGQIPVKVRGLVLIGDYILPSGLNDGTGVGVSPKEIKPAQYKQIVGVAWSEALISGGIGKINMAIGLNNNDLANLAVEQEKKIAALESKFASLEKRLVALEGGASSRPAVAPAATEPAKAAPAPELNRYALLAKNMPAELSNKDMTDAFATLKAAYIKKGISIASNPGLNKLLTDATYQAEVIRKSQATYRASYQAILEKSKQ